ncbi:YlaH-like family protein [Caldibacillus debilis]|jgi:NADH:ubiquinone oxidoreductase subunit K|uniref:YlaH-like protein n=1 Tax=Caldibacillus debilis GB1 TaxID=1339248 RepID=A0A420VJW0_9BACI|nr:YlaH-like family protein [Caldibacillus debilis]RKO63840.1 YlaH-like protein [Caldibacillus debilis GB1]
MIKGGIPLEDIQSRLSPISRLLRVDENPDSGMWILYILIVFLCIIAYKLGFARKLPLLKSAIVYLFLILGSTILTFLAIFLPVAEGLIVIALVLAVYRFRRWREGARENPGE